MCSISAFFADLSQIFHSRLFIIAIVLTFTVPAYCDSKSIARQEIPVELRASDPDIKGLIDTSADKWELGDSVSCPTIRRFRQKQTRSKLTSEHAGSLKSLVHE
jgi:hypothetical protein